MRQLFRKMKRIYHACRAGGRQELFFSGGNKWIFFWIERYLEKALMRRYPVYVRRVENPWKLDVRKATLCFMNRNSFLNRSFERLHPTNRLFLSWYHGDVLDPEPEMRRLFERLGAAQDYLTKIIVPCSITQRSLLRYGIEPGKIARVPIGVDTDAFRPPDFRERALARKRLGIPDDAFCVGSFQKDGNGWGEGLEPKWVKAPEVFLETVQLMRRQCRNLWVLLTGPARGFVKRGLESMGVPYTHRYPEKYQEISACYHALDLYLIASRCEGGPAALLESWASGVPVVSTRVGMSADWIVPDENGLVAEVDDAAGLARHCVRMAGDEELRARCVRRAAEDVKACGWNRVADTFFDAVCAPVLAKRGAKP